MSPNVDWIIPKGRQITAQNMHIESSVSSVERGFLNVFHVCVCVYIRSINKNFCYIFETVNVDFLHTHLVHVYSYFNESRSVGATNMASNQITPHDVENDSDRISQNSYIAHAYQSIFFITTAQIKLWPVHFPFWKYFALLYW